MSRYTQASCKKCRKMSQKLFLKGHKCATNCVVDRAADKNTRRKGAPRKMSDYAKHLREKQAARLSLQMGEAQFRRFFSIASKTKGKTGETLLRMLELRLDNIVKRIGFSDSIKMARQLVNHGHVKVNGRTVNIPSYIVSQDEEIALDPRMAEKVTVKQSLENMEKSASRPSFITYDPGKFTGKLVRIPERAELSTKVDEQLIVEFYSK